VAESTEPNDPVIAASRSVLIDVLTVLGKYLDKIAIVGGWVLELLFPGRGHIGSLDVDLALDASRIPAHVYETIKRDLLSASYQQTDPPNRFLRAVGDPPVQVKVDLLAPESARPAPERSHAVVQGMPVWVAHGIDLAFAFPTTVPVSGTLPEKGRNTVQVPVPRVGAFLCMKAITMSERKKEKDAYDIYFCVANYPGGPDALAEELRPMLSHPLVREGLARLREKFSSLEDIGPVWAAQVVAEHGGDEEITRRDAFERVNALLDRLGLRSS